MLVKLFEPHPGLAGCLARIPGDVRMVALTLDGQTMELDSAVALVEGFKDGTEVVEVSMPYEYPWSGDTGMILLRRDYPGGRIDSWRVIKFKEVKAYG